MVRRLTVLVGVGASAWALVSAAGASSVTGAQLVQTTATSPNYLFIDAAYSGHPIFDPWHYSHPLTDLGCSFRPASPSREGATSNVRLRISGSTSGDLYDPSTGAFIGQRDALHARLVGRVLDAVGRRYAVSGTFFDDGSRHVLAGQDFYGIGQVTISDSGRRIAGEAILYRVVEGGDSWSIDFTHIDTCS
jgi:hypothetical protein